MKQLLQDALDCITKDVTRSAIRQTTNKLRVAIDAPEQEPVGWLIDGGWMFLRGEFAEMDAKAEAARCGGTCKAFPVYTQPQPVADDTFKPDWAGYRQGVEDGKAELMQVAELTDEELKNLWLSADVSDDAINQPDFLVCARAVLAAQRGKV